MFRTYGKAIVALAIAGLTALASALTDDHVTAQETVQIAIAATTAASVWLVPAVPQWPWMKTAVAALLAALNVAVTAILGGISGEEWVNIALAALGVLGVSAAPALTTSGLAAPKGPL